MEKPYKIRKALIKMGNSVGLIIPNFWIMEQIKKLKIKRVNYLDVECYSNRLVIAVSN